MNADRPKQYGNVVVVLVVVVVVVVDVDVVAVVVICTADAFHRRTQLTTITYTHQRYSSAVVPSETYPSFFFGIVTPLPAILVVPITRFFRARRRVSPLVSLQPRAGGTPSNANRTASSTFSARAGTNARNISSRRRYTQHYPCFL